MYQYQVVDPALITEADDNIRSFIEEESLNELVESINERGLLNPLTLEKGPDKYRIIAGHRRFAAWQRSKYAGQMIPAVALEPLDDADRITAMLIENCQRVDITPLDEAFAYQSLVDQGLRQTAIAKKVGKSDAHVSKRLSLTRLPEKLQTKLRDGKLRIDYAYRLAAVHPDILNEQEFKRELDDWQIKQLESRTAERIAGATLDKWLENRTDIVEERPNAAYVGRFTGANVDSLMVSDKMVIFPKLDYRGNKFIEVYDTSQIDEDEVDEDAVDDEVHTENMRLQDQYRADLATYNQARIDWLQAQTKKADDLNRMIDAILLGWIIDSGDINDLAHTQEEEQVNDELSNDDLFLKYLGHPLVRQIIVTQYADFAEGHVANELAALGIHKPERPEWKYTTVHSSDEDDDNIIGDDFDYDPIEEDYSDDVKYESDYYAVEHE